MWKLRKIPYHNKQPAVRRSSRKMPVNGFYNLCEGQFNGKGTAFTFSPTICQNAAIV